MQIMRFQRCKKMLTRCSNSGQQTGQQRRKKGVFCPVFLSEQLKNSLQSHLKYGIIKIQKQGENNDFHRFSELFQCICCSRLRVQSWESVRFASVRSRVRSSSSPPKQGDPNLFPIGDRFGFILYLGKN